MADLVITATGVLANAAAETSRGIAGGTITRGDAIYKDTADGNSYKRAANTAAGSVVAGIALNDASDGQPVDFCTSGDIDLGATLTVGETYFLSTNAGKIRPVADLISGGGYATKIGIATTASNIALDIHVGGVSYV